jgi:hypothetical protein
MSVWRLEEKAMFTNTVQTEHNTPINIQAIIIIIIIIIIGITAPGFK